jgi:hypothetical protein
MYLECTQSKDIATNKSTISWKLSTIGGTSNYYASRVTVTIGGTEVYASGYVNWDAKKFPAAKGSTSGTVTLSHDEYGNKSIDVKMTVMIYDGVDRNHTGSWTLDNIPRQATITSASSFTSNGNPPTVYYSNLAGNNVTSLEICIADDRAWGAYTVYRPVEKNGTSYTFTQDDIDVMRNLTRNTLNFTFVLRTYIGGVYLYSASDVLTFTMVEDDTTKPSVNLEVTLNNSSLDDKFAGMCIQGKSRLDVSISASGKYGASITSYSTAVDGKTYNSTSFTTDVISTSGNVEVKGYAKDTRGFTGSASWNREVIPYSKPLVVPVGDDTAISCYRSDGNGVRVGNSESVWIKAKMTYYSVRGENSCVLEWRRKKVSDPWNDSEHPWTVLTTGSEYNALLEGVVFDRKTSYTVQIRAIDTIKEYDLKTFEIPTENVALHLGSGGKKVSVGTYCSASQPDESFYSEWEAIFDKDVIVGGDIRIGENKTTLRDYILNIMNGG